MPLSVSAAPTDAVLDMDLEGLMALEVTGVSKRAEPLGRTAAAVFVVTGEDIRRSGARTIAEALRMVPGLDVARTNAQSYEVSARGFRNDSGGKLEVVLDGRSVYTPLTSDVFWDVLDTYLPDIERIEVIRGPGGTVWGANAVNGVINIVTRSAAETQGTVLSAGGGTEETAFASFRSGGRFGDKGSVRAYAKVSERGELERPGGMSADDGQVFRQGGLRADWASGVHAVTGSADVYEGHSDDNNGNTDVNGGNVTGSWRYQHARGAQSSLNVFLDLYDRRISNVYAEERRTANIDLQHDLAQWGRHRLTLGAGFRFTQDETGGMPLLVIFDPQDRTLRRYSGFIQDQIGFGNGRGTLVLGTKIEHNDFTGTEVQPGARLGWALSDRWFLWSSVARAVRTPNRLDHDIAIFCSPAIAGLLGCTAGTVVPFGSPDFDSESLVAYELGLRARPRSDVLVELAAFFNDYDDLQGSDPMPNGGATLRNAFSGVGSGVELNASWSVNPRLRLNAFYAFLDLDLELDAPIADTTTEASIEGGSPQHSAGLDLAWTLNDRWQASSRLRYVDEIEADQVPQYAELDLRVHWQFLPSLGLSVVGQSLLDARHPEDGSLADRYEVPRGVYAELSWRWN